MLSVNDAKLAQMTGDSNQRAFAIWKKNCVDLGAVLANVFDLEQHWKNGATPEDLVKMSQSGPC